MGPPPRDRKLGLLDATLLVMGGILGVGIFFNPAQVAALVPHEGAFLGVWLVGGLVAICGAFTFAEYGATFPHVGGWFVYLRRVYAGPVAFLFAWVVLFVISTGALAVIARFGAASAASLLPFLGPEGSPSNRGAATALIAAITALALGGVKVGATFQNACMVVKLGAIAALLVAGLAFVGAGSAAEAGAAAAAPPPPAGPAPPLWRGVILAMLPVLFSVGGWQMLGYAAGEVRDAQRTIPRAVLLGVGGVVLAYLLLNLDYLRVLGIERLAGDFGFATEVARRSFGPAGEQGLAAAMAVSAVGICAVNIITSPYIYVAMSREGLFFESFGRLSPTTGAPVLALLLQGALAVLYVWIGKIERLVDSVVFVEWFFHGLVAWGLIRLRRRQPELPRPYRSPLWPLMPALYALVALGVVAGTLWQAERRTTFTGLAVVAAGLLAYPLWVLGFRRARAGAPGPPGRPLDQ